MLGFYTLIRRIIHITTYFLFCFVFNGLKNDFYKNLNYIQTQWAHTWLLIHVIIFHSY